jgi:hypothetical protein
MSLLTVSKIQKESGATNIDVPSTGQWIDLASAAQGDVLYYNGTSYVRLAPGTSGQFLTSGGAGANPSWTTVATADSVLLSTQTASGVASINFDNTLVTSTYKTYEVRFFNVVGATDDKNVQVKFSDDNGSNFDSNHTSSFDSSYVGASGAGSGYDTAYDSVNANYTNLSKHGSSDAGDSAGGVIRIQNPTDASFITTYQYLTSNISNDATPYLYALYGGGMWDSLAAVNYFRFQMDTGNLTTGTFQLWGYK